MLLQSAGLAAVTAGLATVIAGRRFPDVGTFAAALGLAAVSLRGGTAGSLVIQWADSAPVTQSSLPLQLALEAIAWFVIIFLARVFAITVERWCFDGAHGERTEGEPNSEKDSMVAGIKHTVIAGGAALLAFKVLTAGLATRSVQHGQACFVVAASVCLAAYLAYWVAPVRTALWGVLSVPILAVCGYVWARLGSSPEGLPASVPPSAFLRVLPIQYISVGAAAAVAMFWYLHHRVGESSDEDPPRPRASAEGRGS